MKRNIRSQYHYRKKRKLRIFSRRLLYVIINAFCDTDAEVRFLSRIIFG
jgi:hypothetical protein